MKSVLLIAVLCIPLLIGGFYPAGGLNAAPVGVDEKPGKMKELPINTGKPYEVKRGEQFSLALDSNQTTGYHWRLAKPLDEGVLKLAGVEYKTPQSKLLGAGGKEIWTFQAVGRGVTSIHLEYVRPWEKGVPPARTAVYTVRVTE